MVIAQQVTHAVYKQTWDVGVDVTLVLGTIISDVAHAKIYIAQLVPYAVNRLYLSAWLQLLRSN